MSKTAEAIKYLRDHPGCSPYRAAQMVGITYSVLYRALKREPQQVCPCCGRKMLKPVKPMEPD